MADNVETETFSAKETTLDQDLQEDLSTTHPGGSSKKVEETEIGDIVTMENTLNQDSVKSEELNQHVGSVLEDDCKENLPASQLVTVLTVESNVAETERTRMVTDLERGSIFVHKDAGVASSLKIEVIDDTALIEYLPEEEEDSGSNKKKAKLQSRRKAKVAKRMAAERFKNVTPIVEEEDSGFKKSRRIYSRQEMEALRFTDIVQQRNLWRAIYTGLGAVVSAEYDRLANSKQKNNFVDFDPRRHFQSKMDAPGILREGCSRKPDNELEYIEDCGIENLTGGDPTCCHTTEFEGASTVTEEDYDTDEDYASIQRPAFFVQGEPDFDAGPPEDGLEYLRRVRWEAAHIPKVKVAKLGENKYKKEQSIYMPQIPDIEPCPEHMQPLKEWEDSFLADFSELRQVLSVIDNSSAQTNDQSLLIYHKDNDCSEPPESVIDEHRNRFEDGISLHNFHRQSVIDQPSALNDQDNKISPCHQSHGTANDSSNAPMVSVILRMDSVARVSMLRKRINSLENSSILSADDCVWLFALCAAVDTPLDADTCACLRSLLRKCASLRARKSEVDDEVVILNILATLCSRYFGQSMST